MEDKFFTLNEVSAYLKIPKSTLYKLSQRKEIPSVKIGKQLRFRKSSLDKWISEGEAESVVSVPNEPLASQADKEAVSKTNNVLLVDDDTLVRRSIAKLLNTCGYNVDSAASGEEALEKAKSKSFDLIVADVRMAGMDGIEAIEKIREFYNKSQKTPPQEIVITGYMDTQAEERANRLGIEDYLYKPFSVSEFISAVKGKTNFRSYLN
ncbi:MAG: response regulator [Candidatus Omnitrophota bacterium]|nr:response regulator [Candidatus Omnitrophota bacterium]